MNPVAKNLSTSLSMAFCLSGTKLILFFYQTGLNFGSIFSLRVMTSEGIPNMSMLTKQRYLHSVKEILIVDPVLLWVEGLQFV